MRKILEFFAKRHILATLITIMILLLGVNSLRTLQRDRFPNVDWGWVDITTVYPGASPEDVELNVTNKIEDALKGVTGIKEMYSLSIEDVSNVSVQIDPNVKDMEKVKNNIRDAIGRVTDLPEEVTEAPLIGEATTSSNEIILVGITGDLPYRELREKAKLLKKKLEAVPGVARLESIGYRDREIKVEVDPGAMDAYQISLGEIIRAIKARNIRLTGGTFESYTSEKNVVTLAQFSDPREVADVTVRSSFDGPLIKVKDLAAIRDDFEEESVIARVGKQKAVVFSVYKNEDVDIIRTVKAIRKMISDESERVSGARKNHPKSESWSIPKFFASVKRMFQKRDVQDEFPYGEATIHLSLDISKNVENSFRIVFTNGAIGLTLVLLILSVFLNPRTAFWVAMGIPVSIMGVCFLLPAFDSFLDTVTLTVLVIVIGIIVDDGIIISESISQHRERGETPLQAAVNGTQKVFFPVVTTVVTTFVAFAPMFFMTGEIGKVVWVIPLTLGLALLFSIIEALFAMPSHLARGMERSSKRDQGNGVRRWFTRLKDFYYGCALRFLKYRYLLVALFILAFAGSILYASKSMRFVLFPSKGAERFYLSIELPTGSSLDATVERIKEVENIIADLPEEELESFMGYVGRTNWGSTQNRGLVAVSLTPFSTRERNADRIIEELRQKIEKIEGIDQYYFDVDTGGPGVGKPVTLRIIGNDEEMRRRLTNEIKEYLATIEGVKDIDSNDDLGKDQIEIKPYYDRLDRLGLTVEDVARNVRIAFDGEVVTTIRQGDEDVNFRVQLAERARKDIGYLKNLSIPNQDGRLIKLGMVCGLKIRPAPLAFRHFDGERTTTITADLDQDLITSLEATNLVMSHFDLEDEWPGMRWLVGGEAEESMESIVSLITSFVIAVVGIYFLLVLLFSSFSDPLYVMFALPFGIIGVIIAFALHGVQPSFLGMLGMIGMAGVVVNDSLVLVNHLNELRKQKPGSPLLEIIAEGSSNRLRAIVLTSITTIAGLLPLAYGIGGSDIYMSPLALAMGYGILFATPLTLVLVPCLYAIGTDLNRIFKKKQGK